ncbi:MAG: hypothetical protein ABW321_02820 [Polyangiales bacterium]
MIACDDDATAGNAARDAATAADARVDGRGPDSPDAAPGRADAARAADADPAPDADDAGEREPRDAAVRDAEVADAAALADSGNADAPLDAAAPSEAGAAGTAGRGQAGTGGTTAALPEGCPVPAPTMCPDPMPRYADVEPIIAARCVTCHNGQNGEWSLGSYQHVADWFGEIRARMINCTMPPRDSGQTMTVEERLAILRWIRCGFPR